MAVDSALARRVRSALSAAGRVEEKRMFGGLTFMVRGKMCISVRRERIMCRIDPEMHDQAVAAQGCRTVVMKGRLYRGWVYVDAEVLRTKRALDRWINMALEYNARMDQRGGRMTT
ncbi:MAG: TfoX/Sxy family protein [Gemmatimonadaceae bacterium]